MYEVVFIADSRVRAMVNLRCYRLLLTALWRSLVFIYYLVPGTLVYILQYLFFTNSPLCRTLYCCCFAGRRCSFHETKMCCVVLYQACQQHVCTVVMYYQVLHCSELFCIRSYRIMRPASFCVCFFLPPFFFFLFLPFFLCLPRCPGRQSSVCIVMYQVLHRSENYCYIFSFHFFLFFLFLPFFFFHKPKCVALCARHDTVCTKVVHCLFLIVL